MPELPEVETTRRGIAPHLLGRVIEKLAIHNSALRWPIAPEVFALEGAVVESVDRRGKYLLIGVDSGQAIIHLGMSGSLRICAASEQRREHDHVEWTLASGRVLRYHDPRRFGCLLWQAADAPQHPLLIHLGPEPLSPEFNGDYLFARSRKRNTAIKNLIMNSRVVVGVGNIYASEALFLAGIRPGRAARRITRREAARLAETIKRVLQDAIQQGGTTLRDFINSDGSPGYFAQSLNVYGRAGADCLRCGSPIQQRVIGQRSSFYCRVCQK